jgi:hypothetical protein
MDWILIESGEHAGADADGLRDDAARIAVTRSADCAPGESGAESKRGCSHDASACR